MDNFTKHKFEQADRIKGFHLAYKRIQGTYSVCAEV